MLLNLGGFGILFDSCYMCKFLFKFDKYASWKLKHSSYTFAGMSNLLRFFHPPFCLSQEFSKSQRKRRIKTRKQFQIRKRSREWNQDRGRASVRERERKGQRKKIQRNSNSRLHSKGSCHPMPVIMNLILTTVSKK